MKHIREKVKAHQLSSRDNIVPSCGRGLITFMVKLYQAPFKLFNKSKNPISLSKQKPFLRNEDKSKNLKNARTDPLELDNKLVSYSLGRTSSLIPSLTLLLLVTHVVLRPRGLFFVEF